MCEANGKRIQSEAALIRCVILHTNLSNLKLYWSEPRSSYFRFWCSSLPAQNTPLPVQRLTSGQSIPPETNSSHRTAQRQEGRVQRVRWGPTPIVRVHPPRRGLCSVPIGTKFSMFSLLQVILTLYVCAVCTSNFKIGLQGMRSPKADPGPTPLKYKKVTYLIMPSLVPMTLTLSGS